MGKNNCLVIPARLDSTRLKNKLLIKINNKYLIEYTIYNALRSKKINKVFLVSPNDKIFKKIRDYKKIFLVKSNGKYSSASSRISSVIGQLNYKYIFVLFGDEPLIKPNIIDQFAKKVFKDKNSYIWNATSKFKNKQDIKNQSNVKCYLDRFSNIKELSRSLKNVNDKYIKKSIGLFCFKSKILKRIKKLGLKNNNESIEQQSILNLGFQIKSVGIENDIPSVNTKHDLERIKKLV